MGKTRVKTRTKTEGKTFEDLLGLKEGRMPEDFGVKADDDPVYERVISSPAEDGVDDPDRVVVAVFSDDTYADAKLSPYEPTNPNDPVSPQRVSQSTGAVPYEEGVLHAFPDDPHLETEPPPTGGGGNGGGEEDLTGTITAFTAEDPTEVTTDAEDAGMLTVGGYITLEALSGDESAQAVINGERIQVLSVSPTTLDLDLSTVDVTDLTADYVREST